MSSPSNRMRPPLATIWPRIALPIVVLPEPDSPTNPSVSPGAIARLTPFEHMRLAPAMALVDDMEVADFEQVGRTHDGAPSMRASVS